jgi:hypothetical protein
LSGCDEFITHFKKFSRDAVLGEKQRYFVFRSSYPESLIGITLESLCPVSELGSAPLTGRPSPVSLQSYPPQNENNQNGERLTQSFKHLPHSRRHPWYRFV